MKDPATIALCVGHSRLLSNGLQEGGAWSHDGKCGEWKFNEHLARLVAMELHDCHGITAVIVNRYEGQSYGAAMRWLAEFLKSLGNVKLAVELHFNCADEPAARGHEWLYWHQSAAGERLARKLAKNVGRDFPDLPARGVKARVPGDRGAEFLRLTHCPAVICEPFFGSNRADWHVATTHTGGLARSMADALAAAHD